MIAFDQTKPLLKDGKDIQYRGQTGIGPFNKNNDPSSANIGVYTFDKDNKPVFDHTQSGDVIINTRRRRKVSVDIASFAPFLLLCCAAVFRVVGSIRKSILKIK